MKLGAAVLRVTGRRRVSFRLQMSPVGGHWESSCRRINAPGRGGATRCCAVQGPRCRALGAARRSVELLCVELGDKVANKGDQFLSVLHGIL